jgi:protocatechuate 3,4-dioxygenase alpha subunit
MATMKQTPSQTVGPYFAYGLTGQQYGYKSKGIADGRITRPDTDGTHIRIEGVVYDGAGKPVTDALIEVWQADAHGRYAHPADPRGSNAAFKGFGRVGTGPDPEHRFIFDTVKPGRVDARQAPHINVIVTMRGMLNHLFTRMYFDDEVEANAADPVLQSVPAERRATLIAIKRPTAAGPVYRFDIHMQGAAETVFFDA